jgi:hypothetical protein
MKKAAWREELYMQTYFNLSKSIGRQVWLIPTKEYHNMELISAALMAFAYGLDERIEFDNNPLLVPVRNFNSIGLIDPKYGKLIIKNASAFKKELKIK